MTQTRFSWTLIQPANLTRNLGGVLDFTGELNRYAVLQATRRDVEAVRACRGLVEGIFGQFLQVSRCLLIATVLLLCKQLTCEGQCGLYHRTNVAVCLQYDLRNGAIRKKFDSLKYTLKKLEVCVLPAQCRPDRCMSTQILIQHLLCRLCRRYSTSCHWLTRA